MIIPEGYRLEKVLASSSRSDLALAVRESDQTQVVLKAYKPHDAHVSRTRIEREFEALRACEGSGICRALEVAREGAAILVLEYVRGVTLDAWISNGLPTPLQIVRVAIQIGDVLTRMHELRLVHRDLSPSNVMVDAQASQVYVIDFGAARPLGAQSIPFELSQDSHRACVHHYIAPEQTGRMSRGVDERSDLYSLGAVLYRIATGRTPFDEDDPLSLLHAHMARVPLPASRVRPELPEVLSRILAKLLEKEPGARYQSARALCGDLRVCERQLQDSGGIDPSFRIGASDAPDRLDFGSKLYGRDSETARIKALYADAAGGATRVLLVRGEPGAGKSALVDQVRGDLGESRGYLGVGKFDQARERPYSGWSAALNHFAQQLLLESDARLADWRRELQMGLGTLARVVVELAPDFGFILGETAEVPMVGPRASQARLAVALERLLGVCARPTHPLILFLDDLQWSDAASRSLLVSLLSGPRDWALLVVGAYRTRDVTENHPLATTLEKLTEQFDDVDTLALGSLSLEAATEMLADVLEHPSERVADLAREVGRKTGNMPLFISEFVGHLHARGILRFAHDSGWSWSLQEVEGTRIPEGAVGLISARLFQLPERMRSLIELASCIGDEFDQDLLSELGGIARDDIVEPVYALVDAGLIVPSARGFRFAHDRIREAACAMGDTESHAELYCNMARRLLEKLAGTARETRLLEIAEYQAKGVRYLRADEREVAAELQLRAGERALAAGAAATAENYLSTARALIDARDWEARKPLAVALYLRSAESSFLRGDLDPALCFLEQLEQHDLDPLQQAQADAQRIQILALTQDSRAACDYTLEVLRATGLRCPRRPSKLMLVLELYWLRIEIALRGADRIFRPATRFDLRRIAQMIIISQGGAIIARTDQRLIAWVLLWTTRQNLRHGYIGAPAISLAAVTTGMPDRHLGVHGAERLHDLAMAKNASEPNHQLRLRAEQLSASQFRPWQHPRHAALAPLEAIAESQREAGDVEWANYSSFLGLVLGGLAGRPVRATADRLGELVARVWRANHIYLEPLCCHLPYSLLIEPNVGTIDFAGRIAAGEDAMARGGRNAESFGRSVWLMVLCVYGRFDLAFSVSEAFYADLFKVLGLIHVADHVFYRGLAAGAMAVDETGVLRRRHLRALEEAQRRVARWIRRRRTPDLVHMQLMLDAERHGLRGRLSRARSLYERALAGAIRQGYPHHAALAAERLAALLDRHNLRSAAAIARFDAAARYRAWGCTAKSDLLEQDLASQGIETAQYVKGTGR